MTCGDVKALAGNYLDEELPEELQTRVRRHLLKCAGCAQEVTSQKMALEALQSACAATTANEEFIQDALSRLCVELGVEARQSPTPGQLVLGIGPD